MKFNLVNPKKSAKVADNAKLIAIYSLVTAKGGKMSLTCKIKTWGLPSSNTIQFWLTYRGVEYYHAFKQTGFGLDREAFGLHYLLRELGIEVGGNAVHSPDSILNKIGQALKEEGEIDSYIVV